MSGKKKRFQPGKLSVTKQSPIKRIVKQTLENNEVIDDINRFLHEAGKYIIGRMGIPYREKGINIISIAIDAPQDVISSLSGKIGRLRGVSAKTAYSNVITKAEDRK